MEDLKIIPPEESEQETSFGKIFLRIGAVFLCTIVSIALILLGYLAAIILNLDLEIFNTYTGTCFLASIVIWMLIGLLTPFILFQRFLEEIREVTAVRVIVSIAAFISLVFLNWYVANILAEMIA